MGNKASLSLPEAGSVAPDFVWPVRVYYEDTDAGGVVFYANYLAFMERARTEWLRQLGFENQQLMTDEGMVFIVRRVSVDYLQPARLDDALQVSVQIRQLKGASLVIDQHIFRGEELLCQGEILLACVDTADFRPKAIPQSVKDRMNDVR